MAKRNIFIFSSLQFRCSVLSDSLRPHEPQHIRPPCPSPVSKFTQTHVRWVSDAIQPSRPLSSPSPPAFSHSQHPFSSVQFSSVMQSCPTLCNPMNHSTPGLPVHHQPPESTQTHVHWVSDGIQPSHPRLSPSPPALNPSQHQRLFKWVSSSHQVAKVLEFQLQYQSFQWIFRIDLLYNGLGGFPYSPRDSQEPAPTPQFKSINSSGLSFL